jgi:Concanavalin A-like lectin/glucanases superfamily
MNKLLPVCLLVWLCSPARAGEVTLPPDDRPQPSPANASEPAPGLRFTVELTDGSRLLGSPESASFAWQTGLGRLPLNWQVVKSVEQPCGGGGFLVALRNGDAVEGTPETSTFKLHTLLGDLTVPFALTRRIGIDVLACGGGPVVYWSFDDPANLGEDNSGHDHTLAVKGALPTEGRIGKAAATRENRENQGLAEYLIIDSHPDLQFSGDFTLAVWVWRSAPFYDGDQIIAKEGEFSLRRYQFPTERYNVELFGKQGLSLAKVSETKSGLPLESWTLIVVIRQDDRLSIRVNDLPAVEAKVEPGEVGGDNPLMIGSSPTGYPWQGKLDEIKKWNRALSEDEQRELFRDPPVKP